MLVREQVLLTRVLDEVRKAMPFPLLGFDTDNDSVFMNETVRAYCADAGVEFTRCWPYRKNDQAWVEQKNGSVVRRTVGYRRYEGIEAASVLARLYKSMRFYVNHFQPSFKLAGKEREGSKVRKRYHKPATPYARLIAHERTTDDLRRSLAAVHATLDSVALLRDIRAMQGELVSLADRPAPDNTAPPTAQSLEQFLSGLRTAWQDGEVRPTARTKSAAKRGRRRLWREFGADRRRFSRGLNHSSSQEIDLSAAVHLAFDELEPGDLPLGLPVGPRLDDGSLHRVLVGLNA